MKARTSRSLLPSTCENFASCVTVANRSPLPWPNVSAASESRVSIWLPSRPSPFRFLAPAWSRWSRVPSLFTPLGPSASERSRRLA